jgi:hypothetical protein
VEELLGHMERLSISRALVRTDFEEMDGNVPLSNRMLYETCATHRSLVPCPSVLPAACGDVPSEQEQIDELIRNGGCAATARPNRDSWSIAEWCSGKLFSILEERRVPMLCRQANFEFEAIADLAKRYPALPIVLFQVGYRHQRVLVPLMKAFSNVYLAIGSPYSVHRGVESMTEQVGAERLLFGTGFPSSDMMPAITMLTYAEISDSDRRLIASGNLDRLIGGIRK